jgi:hydroxypyruvate isomerase
MVHKFSSNLSFMFQETPLLIDRYQLAKDAGFKAVESGFPLGFTVEQVAEAKRNANIDQALINVYTGIIIIYYIKYLFMTCKQIFICK